MKIITVTGYKGGVGKSTTAFHLAAFFSEKGKTILVDGDPNRTALKWAERAKKALPFTVADQRQSVRMVSGADYVIIDTPASRDSNDLKELSKGCDILILPTAPDIVSLEPMLEVAEDLGEARFRALVTIVPPPPSHEGEYMLSDLKEGGIPVFETMIRRTIGFARAALAGLPIRDIPDARFKSAWDDYAAVGKEVVGILK